MDEADFAWSDNATSPTLEGITLTVRKGELVGVFGRVGAGKVIHILLGVLKSADLIYWICVAE